jgi:fermentation-respiration switch protein FrsA (DUF1100 family)
MASRCSCSPANLYFLFSALLRDLRASVVNSSANPRYKQVARGAWRVLRAVLVTYLLVVLAMTFLETWLVYPVPPRDDGDWQAAGLAHEDVWFESGDGTRLYGWFVPNVGSKRALLYCHGNGEHVAYNADLVAHLRDALDASVFIFDYRGYGKSEGRPDESGCIADGLAAQRWLAERVETKPSDIVLMGRSLGGAVAVAAAADQGARALVLESTFSRMTDVAAYHYPLIPVRLVMRNRYESISRIGRYTGPLVQSHGLADQIIPIQFGRRLFDAAPSRQKRFIELPGRGHNDPPPASYYRQLAAFLDGVSSQPGADGPAAGR